MEISFAYAGACSFSSTSPWMIPQPAYYDLRTKSPLISIISASILHCTDPAGVMSGRERIRFKPCPLITTFPRRRSCPEPFGACPSYPNK